MFIHFVRCLFTLLTVCFTCKYAKPSPTWLNSVLPEGSVCVCFFHPSLWLIIGIQKGMVPSRIKSLFVLTSPGNLSRSLPGVLLGCAHVLFPLFWSPSVEGHSCAPKCPSLPFLSLSPRISLQCVITDPLKLVSLRSQSPWSILSYYCCLFGWHLFFIFPKWEVSLLQSLSLFPPKCLCGNCPSISVISYTLSMINSKLSQALTFPLSSSATFPNTQ